jgi:hypothetical protein
MQAVFYPHGPVENGLPAADDRRARKPVPPLGVRRRPALFLSGVFVGADRLFRDRVRSLSGNTARWLGEPEWV